MPALIFTVDSVTDARTLENYFNTPDAKVSCQNTIPVTVDDSARTIDINGTKWGVAAGQLTPSQTRTWTALVNNEPIRVSYYSSADLEIQQLTAASTIRLATTNPTAIRTLSRLMDLLTSFPQTRARFTGPSSSSLNG